jgi:hypothetical protein
MATPATGFLIGTQASINDKQDPQTDPIEVEPQDPKHSETTLIV